MVDQIVLVFNQKIIIMKLSSFISALSSCIRNLFKSNCSDCETLKYDLSSDKIGLRKFIKIKKGQKTWYHVHSDEMTDLECWIHNLLISITKKDDKNE